MNSKARIAASLVLAAALSACTGPTPNLHRVDAKVWRSGQPDRRDFRDLQKAGIRQVLCLRKWHDDQGLATDLTQYRVPMEASRLNDEEMFAALSILVRSEGPILVHCWHGADRTGAVVALYRMVVQRWPRERAIAELMETRYGHHANTFPNIREYLLQVDIGRMRRRLEQLPAGPPTPFALRSRQIRPRPLVSRP